MILLLKKALFLFIIVLLCACSKTNITLQFQSTLPQPGQPNTCFYAGIAMTDITPPPGLPLAGYSTLSSDSKGFRTRLKARAFYFKPADGKPVVIVQCDLLSGSRILHHSVSEKIAHRTDVDASGLVIYGSHTHTGPGNYFSSRFYNSFASNRSGFDHQLYQFLSTQIATAIIKAYENRRPAQLSTGVTSVYHATRNRSLPAYLNNKTITATQKMDRLDAVNPLLYMIRVDIQSEKGTYEPSGAISFFSIHPNARPQHLDNLYSGDIIAYMERDLENAILKKYHPAQLPIHAVINMTHGDNNPNLPENTPENFQTARILGHTIGKKVIELFEQLSQSLKTDVQILFRAEDIDVLQQNQINGVRICEQPVIGCSVLGGAKGKGSFLQHIPPFAPGWPKKWFTGSCQETKQKVLGPFHPLFFPKHHYPHHLLAQVIQIDDVMLLPVPFEIGYEAGKRMAQHVDALSHKMKKTHIKHVIPTACANGYWGYVVTGEEYALQYYEGGHTLYGPNTRKYLSEIHGNLLKALIASGSGGALMTSCQYEMKSTSFYPDNKKYQGKRKEYRSPIFMNDPQESYWSFQWIDLHPSQIDFHLPLIHMSHKQENTDWKALEINGISVNDNGYDMAVIWLDTDSDSFGATYEARWYHPKTQSKELYRFVVSPRNTMDTFYSSVFTGE
ncbi:MAG: neutral/alkaline non-lysosomal ceramidase N-terminal domain-containing protein [Candidatus Magnetomorum sp.]|nr:neutral/alkaline non-lysosomal ceramidase N-terminal domain-containing protein [Candidatus Magnetomorum sp.]